MVTARVEEDEVKPRLSMHKRVSLFIILVLLTGVAVSIASKLVVRSSDAHTSYPEIREVNVRIDNGNIKLSASAGNSVEIDAKTKRVWRSPNVETKVENGILKITGKCPDINVGTCRTDYNIAVPAGTTADVSTFSNVTATGLRGDFNAITGPHGDIKGKDLYGKLQLGSGDGNIDLEKLSSLDVKAQADAGNVDVQFSVSPVHVDVKTTSGDANVDLPNGKDEYKVDASTGTGKLVVDTRNVDSSQRDVQVKSDSGNVTVK